MIYWVVILSEDWEGGKKKRIKFGKLQIYFSNNPDDDLHFYIKYRVSCLVLEIYNRIFKVSVMYYDFTISCDQITTWTVILKIPIKNIKWWYETTKRQYEEFEIFPTTWNFLLLWAWKMFFSLNWHPTWFLQYIYLLLGWNVKWIYMAIPDRQFIKFFVVWCFCVTYGSTEKERAYVYV